MILLEISWSSTKQHQPLFIYRMKTKMSDDHYGRGTPIQMVLTSQKIKSNLITDHSLARVEKQLRVMRFVSQSGSQGITSFLANFTLRGPDNKNLAATGSNDLTLSSMRLSCSCILYCILYSINHVIHKQLHYQVLIQLQS